MISIIVLWCHKARLVLIRILIIHIHSHLIIILILKKNINKEKYLQSNFYHKKFVINKCIAINKVNLYLFAGIIVNFIIAKSAYSIFFQRKYIKKLNLSVIISRRRLQGSRLKIIK